MPFIRAGAMGPTSHRSAAPLFAVVVFVRVVRKAVFECMVQINEGHLVVVLLAAWWM